MPVYEYQCQDCGKKFDVVASLAEKEAGLDPVCPKCGRKRARQIFSRFTLLTGSKTEGDEFDPEEEGEGPASDMAGLGAAGLDGLDDVGSDDYGSSDDLDDID